MVKILLVGHGKMGRMVESLASAYDCEVAGVIDDQSPSHGGGPDSDRWKGVDVAVDFTTPDAVMTNAPVLARRGINLIIGTTGWGKHESELRQIVADDGIGIVVAPNFSTGVVVFEALAAQAAKRFALHNDFGAFVYEAHHSTKKDAPSGTALLVKRAMEQSGF